MVVEVRRRRAVLPASRCCWASCSSRSSARRRRARCARCVERETLVRKIDFPRLAVPLAIVLTALFNLGLNLIAGVRLPARSRRQRRAGRWLELPFLLVACWRCSRSGWRCCCRALFVRYRDIEPIWDVVLQVALLRLADLLLDRARRSTRAPRLVARRCMMLNPFAAILQQARTRVIDPSHVSAGAGVRAAGLARWSRSRSRSGRSRSAGSCFRREAPRIAEEL